MANDLDGGITRNGTGTKLDILGQTYYLKAFCDTTFAFETNSLPVHIHPKQDEFILVLDGELDLKLDGVWSKARAGDLVRMPKGIPHGYFNKSDKLARALFWVSPAGALKDLFLELDGMSDPEAVVKVSAAHDVDFLPPDAND
jgi:uncharacterized RmlC-like cupin family protein